MPLISLLVALAVFGVILWLVNTFIPMAPPIKAVINVVVVIVLCLWLLSVFGLTGYTVPVVRTR